jgi:hypothetical protein
MKIIEDTKLPTDRLERYPEDYCYCCGHHTPCGHCGVCIMSLSLSVLLTIIGSILIFSHIIGVCTHDSMCTAGPGQRAICRGICIVDTIPEICVSNTQCQICQNGILIADFDKNGYSCNDHNKCTENDICSDGECVGEEVICQSEECKTAVCDPIKGCLLVNQPDRISQKDLCTTSRCENGEYSETFKNCFDGNPCTLDACFPLSGTCVHPNSGEEYCERTCTHDDNCTAIASDATYACWDGNCVDITSSEMIIRLTHADIDLTSCSNANHARLQLRFFMDEDIENGIMHLPLTESIVPLYPHLDVFDVQTVNMHEGNGVRTYFSMRTVCHDLEADCFPFINGQYEFVVKRYPCTTIHATHCQMDKPSHTHVTAPINVITCPLVSVQAVSYVPTLRLFRSLSTLNATLEMEDLEAWITDVTFCIPNENIYPNMAKCLLNPSNTQCPYRGCFGTPSKYFDYKINFLSNSNYTGAITTASNNFNLFFERGYKNYHGDRCEAVDTVDSIRFSLLPISIDFQGRVGILDVQYNIPACNNRTESLKSRRLGKVVV